MPKSPKPEGVRSSPRANGKQPKPTIRDLNKRKPNEKELEALHNAFLKGSPIVTAILGQATVEYELDGLLMVALKNPSTERWVELTTPPGPLSTFSAKIIMGRALNIFDDITKDHLNRIKSVRNAFAHSHFLLTFDTPEILNEIRGARLPPGKRSDRYKDVALAKSSSLCGEDCYKSLCVAAFAVLSRRHTERFRRQTIRHKRKIKEIFRTENAFAPFIAPDLGGATTNYLKWLTEVHTDESCGDTLPNGPIVKRMILGD
jgi:hypothetical protein